MGGGGGGVVSLVFWRKTKGAYSLRLFQGDNKLKFSHFECQSLSIFSLFVIIFYLVTKSPKVCLFHLIEPSVDLVINVKSRTLKCELLEHLLFLL